MYEEAGSKGCHPSFPASLNIIFAVVFIYFPVEIPFALAEYVIKTLTGWGKSTILEDYMLDMGQED